MKCTLPKLPYAYDSLEPYIDAKTMEIHHTKHHQAYVDKLNDALAKHPELDNSKVEDLLKNLNSVPEDIRTAVRNHGGGHLNHSLFWELLKKNVNAEGKIVESIIKKFSSIDKFKEQFSDAAMKVFGSGWAWLVLNNKKLEIFITSNQDSPVMNGNIPILGLDLWEHSYYLKYQNKRAEYIVSFWNIVNWQKVNEIYEKALK
ncbi:MAG: superoxide dismutase [Nanoarchaeota archaeon]